MATVPSTSDLDVIQAIDGHSFSSVGEYFTAMDDYKGGHTVTLTLRRQGEREKVQLTLAAPD